MKKALLSFAAVSASALTITAFECPSALKSHYDDVLVKTASGKAITGCETISFPSKQNRNIRKTVRKSAPKKGYVLYENFSGWNGTDKNWVPDGWTVEHRGKCSQDFTWLLITPNEYYPSPADGDNYYVVNFDVNQDEWLITPQFVAEEDMLLSYYMNLTPMWFYDTRNINFITQEYEGDKTVSYTLQVLIQEEDGEWKPLRDYAEEYKDYTYREIVAAGNNPGLVKQTVALDEYFGKNVRIAFRYLGSDGDTLKLDAIGVGYPTLDEVWYMQPTNSLYWGYYHGDESNLNFFNMPVDIALYPADSPITWRNMSDEEATYSWEYSDQEGTRTLISDDQHEITATYAPERPGQKPKLYDFPVLHAKATHRADATYTSPVEYFQIGGTPHYPTPYGECDFTLMQFPLIHQDIDFISVRDDKLGAYSVPVFGHNEFSDDYWLNYCLNGEEPMEGNYAHLTGIGNVFFVSEDTPLVVNGMRVYGWGRIHKEAELTATIYALDSELHTDYDTFTVIARSKVNGDAVQTLYGEDSKDYLFIPFEFDQPATVQASDRHPAFVFMLEGFDSDAVEYFAPLQSLRPIETGIGAGYMLSEINLQGHTDKGSYKSFKPLQYADNKEYKTCAATFAIGLIAEYPWLKTYTDSIKLLPEESEVSVSLNSYYDGRRLTVKAPEGLAASVRGRYDECILTVEKREDKSIEGTIEITGPGVTLSIPVSTPGSNAASSLTTENSIVSIHDLSGRKVTSTETAGIYIVKYADGKTRKITVK